MKKVPYFAGCKTFYNPFLKSTGKWKDSNIENMYFWKQKTRKKNLENLLAFVAHELVLLAVCPQMHVESIGMCEHLSISCQIATSMRA